VQQLPDAPVTSLSGFRGLRAELLVALKKAPHALTARELAAKFALTPNALRRYLKALEDEGLVRYRREVRGVGAPVYAYSLTAGGEALFPQAYAPVLTAVLQAVRDTSGPEGVRAVLRRQWAPLVEGAPDRLAALPLEERAQLVAEFRSSQGYMAEATMVAPGVARIREHHCALRDVAEQFPELCAAEQELLEELLGVPLERTCHIVSGCASCAYTTRAALPAAAPAMSDIAALPARSASDSTDARPVPSPSPVIV
jgi:DeoR family suf operon transcriptional repressor